MPEPPATPDPAAGAPDDQVERRGLRAAGQLVARTVLTRGIALVGSVALARLLTPADFGVFAVVTLIVTIITVVGDLGLAAGLVQQREEPDTTDLETVLAAQSLLFGGLGLAALIIGPVIVTWLELGPGAAELAFLMALTIVIIPARGIPNLMLSRSLRFGALAASEVIQQAVYFAVAVGCAAAGVGVVSFGIAALAQSLVATLVVWAAWRRRPPAPRLHRSVALRLWRFGIRMQGASLAAWIGNAVVPLFGGLAGGVTAIGYLQFAWRNGQLTTAVDDIVARVGFPALSRLQHDRSRFSRATGTAMEIASIVVVGIQSWLIATAPVLIPVVFSAKWTPAVDAFRLVAAGAVAGTVTVVIRTALNAAGESGTAFRASLVGLAATLVTFPIGAIAGGVTGAGIAFLASSVITVVVYAWSARVYVRIAWGAVTRSVVFGSIAGFIAAAIVVAWPEAGGLLVSGLVYVAAYGLLALAFEGRLVRLLWWGLRPSPRGRGEERS